MDDRAASPERPTPERSLAVRPAEAIDLAPVRPEFLLGYLDLAITGALRYAANQDVYLTPWWDLPSARPEREHGWKRAVLRRNPHGGADHWGHLFLLVHEGIGHAELERESLALTRVRSPTALTEIPLRVGRPEVTLVLRPTYEETRVNLERFARDVVERFRIQLD